MHPCCCDAECGVVYLGHNSQSVVATFVCSVCLNRDLVVGSSVQFECLGGVLLDGFKLVKFELVRVCSLS